MNDIVIDTLAGYFKDEISNVVEKKNDGLIVKLANGKTARVKVVSLS